MTDIPSCTNCGEYPGNVVSDRIEALTANLEATKEALENAASALNLVAWGGTFTSYIDADWTCVNNALDKSRATLAKLEKNND